MEEAQQFAPAPAMVDNDILDNSPANDQKPLETDGTMNSDIKDSDSTPDSDKGDVETADDIDDKRLVTTSPKTKPFIVLVACCAALGGLIFGYDIAGAGATFVMSGFQIHFGWTCAPDDVGCIPATQQEQDLDRGLINGFFGIGATFGAINNPYFAETYGRRVALAISTIVFIFGASIQTSAPVMWVMWLGRIFSGMGVGMLSMCVPVYISECAPEHTRGMLGTLWQVAVTSGIVIASAANVGLKNWSQGWRLSYGGNIVFAIALLICLIFMPESPRWLAGYASEEQLLKAMKKLRYEEDIQLEIMKLNQEVDEEKHIGSASWSELFTKVNTMRGRVLLGMSLQAFQQLCGINAIMFYAPDILNTFFTSDQAIWGTFGLNLINFLSTFITVATIERFGRVKLLLTGGVIMCCSLVTNSVLSSLDQTKTVGYCVLTFAAIFIVGFAISWGPVVWVVCAEIFPLRTRGKATGLTTMTNWAMTTIIGGLFPVASTASLAGCFGFFACVIALGLVTVYLFQPETSDLTILQIDHAFNAHKPTLKRKTW